VEDPIWNVYRFNSFHDQFGVAHPSTLRLRKGTHVKARRPRQHSDYERWIGLYNLRDTRRTPRSTRKAAGYIILHFKQE